MKKFLKVIMGSFFAVLSIFGIYKYSMKNKNLVLIHNKTDKDFRDISLLYSTGEEYHIDEILSYSTYYYTNRNYKESSIVINFKPEGEENLSKVIVGYVHKNMDKTDVYIKENVDGIYIELR